MKNGASKYVSFADVPVIASNGSLPSYTPPDGWTVDSGPTLVTPSNQVSFKAGPLDNCGLKALAVKVGGTDLDADFAPPLGWFVVLLSRSAGSSFDQLKDTDIVWISPTGQSISINSCTNIGTAWFTDAPGKPKTVLAPWILIGLAGYVFYRIWKM